MKILTQKLAMFFVGLGMFFLPAQGIAIPQDPSFNAEHIGISQEGSTMVIEQHVDKAIIDWKDYSIDANELVQYIQPNAESIALNKITGTNPSEIMGDLLANGQIFIINPNGILFGPDSHVNTAGLLATTLNISDADFLEGNYEFSQEQYKELAAIINKGEITISDNGYAVIVAPLVSNEGLIVANLGTVHVGAAERFTVNFDGRNLINFKIPTMPKDFELGTVLIPSGQISDIIRQVVNYDGIIIEEDDMTALVSAGGTLINSGTIQSGDIVETAGKNVYITDSALVKTKTSLGEPGTWNIKSHNFTIDKVDGNVTGEKLSSSLDTNNINILSNLSLKDDIAWGANTTLSITSTFIGGNITATGDNAGLAINTGSTVDGYGLSGKITLSGSNPSLTIGKNTYTIIKDVNELQNINDCLDGHFALGIDIDASTTATWNNGEGFIPIGYSVPHGTYLNHGTYINNDETPFFSGKLDGLGHTIKGLSIYRTNEDNIGLFSIISGPNASIKNMGIVDVSIEGASHIGALTGNLWKGATVANCYSTGTVKARTLFYTNSCSGGLIGQSIGKGSTVNNSYSTAMVTGASEVGGLVGLSGSQATINNCYASGEVNGSINVGGLTGDVVYATIRDSYATGDINGNSSVGGLVGNSRGSTIRDCYALGNINGDSCIGGIVGSIHLDPSYILCSGSTHISNCYTKGDVNGNSCVGRFIGKLSLDKNWHYRTGGLCIIEKCRSKYMMENRSYKESKPFIGNKPRECLEAVHISYRIQF